MPSISRDSLQWQSAVNTFTSIVLAGLIAIGTSGYFLYTSSIDLESFQVEVFLYHGVAIAILILLALAFATRSYFELSRPLDNLEQITHALPLLSAKNTMMPRKFLSI